MLSATEAQIRLLRQAVERSESVLAVHYASGNLYKATDHPVGVTCISVTGVHDSSTRAFSLSDINVADIQEREIALLEQFYDFLNENQDARLIHWNMNNADYGFTALANRYRWLTSNQPRHKPAENRLFDLDQIFTDKYGDGYAPHPKLPNMVALNKLGNRYWMAGKDEADKAESGDYSAIQRSTSEKSRAIARLFVAFVQGSLVTQGSAGTVTFANQQVDAVKIILTVADRLLDVERSLRRRHSKRSTLEVNDEYDIQDLLRSLLVIFFEDVREEVWTPEYAGGSARMDFMLPDFAIAIEVKKSRDSMTTRSVADELIKDRDRYAKEPTASHLICIVADHEGRLINPRGAERDLSRDATGEGIAVTVRILDR